MKMLSKNVVAALIAKIVALVSGLVVQYYILRIFGSEYNGLTSSITQIMSYLVLLESGLGAASIHALYQPLSIRDWRVTSSIITATSISYKKIAYMFSILLIGVSLLVPLIVANEIEFVIAGLLTLITGGSYIASYIWGGKYNALLTADRKVNIIYSIEAVTIALSAIFRVVALKLGYGILIIQLIHLILVIFKNIVIVVYVRRNYRSINFSAAPNFESIKMRWNVLIHSIAGIVVNHTDILLLTLLDSLKNVSVYSVYNNIFGQLSNLLQMVFIQAIQGNFGILYAKNLKLYNTVYETYETIYLIFLYILTSLSLVLVLPFVSLYTKGIDDASNYTRLFLPILFALILLMNLIRAPAVLTVYSAGAFKETQNGAIIESILNFVVSLALYLFTNLGMYGLLIGTIVSFSYRTIDVYYYVYQNLINRKKRKVLRTVFVNSIILVMVVYILYFRIPLANNSYIEWLRDAIIYGIFLSVLFLVANYVLNYRATKNAVIHLISLIRKPSRQNNF